MAFVRYILSVVAALGVLVLLAGAVYILFWVADILRVALTPDKGTRKN